MNTKKFFWLALLAAGGLALTGPSQAQDPPRMAPPGAPADAYGFGVDPRGAAAAEYDEILHLEPDQANGRRVYGTCVVCHLPEGWGTLDGTYPQIAGQLRTVIIKQLADIRARNRDNPLMYPFSLPSTLGGQQHVADVAAYVASLPMTPVNGLGPGKDLPFGEELYEANCVKCHGKEGEGDAKDHIPLIAGQHFNYLMRQFDLIRTHKRRNADSKMVKQIMGFSPREQAAVLDYAARLRPPAEKLAEEGWLNPDFPRYLRPPLPEPPAVAPTPEVPPAPPRRGGTDKAPPLPPPLEAPAIARP